MTNAQDLAALTAVVTGGSSGIGYASAELFLARGARVGLLARGADRLDAAADSLGQGVVTAAADVSDDAAVSRAVASLAGHLGGIDILVCAAGTAGLNGRTTDQVSAAEWDAMMGVNVRGQWAAINAALPYLRCSAHASVVIVSSDSAFVATPKHVPYCTSKGALIALTGSMSVELYGDGIRVNCVCPSIVDTPMSRKSLGLETEGFGNADYPVHRPEDIAQCVAFLASPWSRSVNGQALMADFGYSARSAFPA